MPLGKFQLLQMVLFSHVVTLQLCTLTKNKVKRIDDKGTKVDSYHEDMQSVNVWVREALKNFRELQIPTFIWRSLQRLVMKHQIFLQKFESYDCQNI